MWMARSSLSWQPWSPPRARLNSFTSTSSVCSPPVKGRMKKDAYMYTNTVRCGMYTLTNYKPVTIDLNKE